MAGSLRHTGVRLEELLEVTHLALVSYRLPGTAEVVPLPQIVPSKIVSIFVPLRIDWSAAALLPLAMGMLAAVGVSLIIAGATLVWKRIQLVNDAAMVVVMLFSASALPLIDVPAWWANTSHFLPLTETVGGLYMALFTHQPVTAAWGMGGLVLLVATSLGYLAAGVLAFTLGQRTAKRRGTLGRY